VIAAAEILFDELSRAFQRMARDADRMASLARVCSDDQAGDRPQLRVVRAQQTRGT
jgi:hypothetical protein